MNITFIGGGNMASAIIGGLSKQDGHRIHVVEPHTEKRQALAQQYGVTSSEQAPAFSPDDVVVLAVKPQVMCEVCKTLQTNGALIISIAAGISAAALSRWLGGNKRIVRTIPNTPALVGKGVTGLFAPAGVSQQDKDAATAIMNATGITVWFEQESGIDDITCISGSGPAYVFYFMEGMIAAARDVGFSDADARRLVLATFDGATALAAAQPDIEIAQLRRNVTSPGGTTAEAIASFEKDEVGQAIANGAAACRARAVALSDQLSNQE